MRPITTLLYICLILLSPAVYAEKIVIAVAANFAAPAKQIAVEFEKHTGHKPLLSFGSTGKFYAQIKHGAPFEVFLSADETTPARLAEEGFAIETSRFTYATGRLILWSPRPGYVDNEGTVLTTGEFRHIAIANPKLAPYGAAAIETLTALNLLDMLQPKFVQGENITQTFQFVASGNAELGFVTLSQVIKDGVISEGSGWRVPDNLHQPIKQDAIILNNSKNRQLAASWLEYLKSDKAKTIIKSFGYGI